ncbi:MAG TPA: IPT/TIG domain-containing protein [Candidatus Paceibacterota bacterium]
MIVDRRGFAPIAIALIVAACVIVIGGAFYYLYRHGSSAVPPVATSTPSSTTPVPPASTPPLYPSAGPIGATVTITGTDFAATGNVVTMNGLSAASLKDLPSADGKTIVFIVPQTLGPVCNKSEMCAQFLVEVTPGTAYTVDVLAADGSSSQTIGTFTITGDSGGHLPL